jgi:glycosyltransferase involved in cell wall biosynthesis
MTALRIGIDGDALKVPFSGVGHYIFNLARELDSLMPEATFFAYTRLPARALGLPSARWQVRTEPSAAFRRMPTFLWLKTRARAMASADRLDVFWAGRTLHPGLENVRTLSSVHDLNHLLAPETMKIQSLWSNRLWFRNDLLRANCVLANSAGTAERLSSMLGVSANGVVHPGVTQNFKPFPSKGDNVALPDRLARLGIQRPYLLSVATPEPRKNLDAVLRAFIALKKDRKLKSHQLVLAGPVGWKSKGLEKQLADARAQGVVLAGYVPDDLLPALYALSDALVFPSFYEGFGMPVLEARACGTRVVTSDIPELREAGDEHVVYVEPSVDGVKDGILAAMEQPSPPPTANRTWHEPAKVLAAAMSSETLAAPTNTESLGIPLAFSPAIQTIGSPRRLLIDCSLSLINRTGAHFIAEDISKACAGFSLVRRWRLLGQPLPQGVVRKVCGRLMLKELALLGTSDRFQWPEPKASNLKRLFLDPLYVTRSKLEPGDIVLCHDVGPLSHPELYTPEGVNSYQKAYNKITAARPGIVFVSQSSQNAFEALFGTAFRFLKTIPLYVRSGSLSGNTEPIPGISKPFFLTVAALETRKNHQAAIEAFRQGEFAGRGFSYILCGAKGDGADKIIALAEATPGVKVLGYVSDPQLRWLYSEAKAFLLPSLLEGFGMPALEAASQGLIPIVSRDSALSEAVNGMALQVDPHSVSGIAAAMESVLALDEQGAAELKKALIKVASGATREKFLGEWKDLISSELHA